MNLDSVPMLDGYKVKKEMAISSDKSIYLVESADGLLVLKVFQKTYKYRLYESLSRLTHINIPAIHKAVLSEDCFYVLEEYVEGKTLQEILDTDGALDKKTVIDIAIQLCDVLTYLHNQSPPIIHRDIKPANVMLTTGGIVKLLDFDIAREHKKEASKDTEVVGTKPFAPPEQYGFTQSDHRADIYSLGMLVTVLLTNTYDARKIKDFRVRAVARCCTAFDPRKRYANTRVLRNRILLCVSPSTIVGALLDTDTSVYVFHNSRPQIKRAVVPVIVLYTFTLAFAFVRPHHQWLFNETPHLDLFLATIVVNPRWHAGEAQYIMFHIIVYAAASALAVYFLFAVYDLLRFTYLRWIQRHCLKHSAKKHTATVPFVIASKGYVYSALVLVSIAAISISIPFTDVWVEYDIHGTAILMSLISCVISFALRGGHYPRHYNKAVRSYYKGDMASAVRFTKKSARAKRNHAKMWLADILRLEAEKNLS